MLKDPETFTVDDPRFSTGRVLGPSMLSTEGPEHDRHRDPFAPFFRPGRVRDDFEPAVERIARRLVGDMEGGRADVRTELARPMAAEVAAAVLGLDRVDADRIRGWYDDIVASVSAASEGSAVVGAPAAVELLAEHVGAAIGPGTGMLSVASRALSEAEVVSNAAVMLFGGIETGEGAIATAFAHLLSDPDQLRMALDDPDLLTRAVDESLRLDPSVVQLDRYATRDVDLGDVSIGAGDFVMVSVAAANRDPEVYPEPDRFDLTRTNTRSHLTFAHGAHHCLGLHLARIEIRAALAAAFAGLPGLRLAGPVRMEGTVFRSPVDVPVAWIS